MFASILQIGEEEKKRPEKVTWDGHTGSMEAATRAARANITIEEQILQIHKIKGLLYVLLSFFIHTFVVKSIVTKYF